MSPLVLRTVSSSRSADLSDGGGRKAEAAQIDMVQQGCSDIENEFYNKQGASEGSPGWRKYAHACRSELSELAPPTRRQFLWKQPIYPPALTNLFL